MIKQTMHYKRLLIIAALLIALIGTLLSATTVAFAQPLDNDDFDIVFKETANELYDTTAPEIYLTANKEVLFDMQLQPLGFVYDFTANDENGYAIIIMLNDIITVVEFALGANSPYADLTYNRIYVAYLTYLYETNGDYYTVSDNIKLSDSAIVTLSENAYKGTDAITYSEERVTFNNKTVNKKNLVLRHPCMVQVGGLTNACAPIAGTSLVQYWDRFYENLIPNYTSYTTLSGQIIYKPEDATLDETARTLYTDMQTNVTGAGTTETQFKNGLKTYCSRQGYSNVSYNSCMSGSKFSYSLAKQRLDAGQPLAIFVDTFTVANISENSDYDHLAYLNGNGCHIMAGFGYREVTYVLNDGSTRSDYYLAVASGYLIYARSYFNINLNTIIDDVFGVVIS